MPVKPLQKRGHVAVAPSNNRRFAAVLKRASEVIGDADEALRWLGTPVAALNYSTPVSLLGSHSGEEAVLIVLGRLEHGVL